MRVLRDSVKVKISCISKIVIGVWSLEHLECAMFVDLHSALPNDPKIHVVAYCTQFFTRLANYP